MTVMMALSARVCLPAAMSDQMGSIALIRIAKPGAPIVFTVRDTTWDTDGFAQKIEKLETEGVVRIVDIQLSPYHTKEDVFCQLCVLEVV